MSESATEVAPITIDWSSITAQVECPLCRYNLRGLIEPRCPECGCRFEWAEVLDPFSRHPYLFEHHPKRNLWSFVRTLWGGLRARKFWSQLRPAHKVKARRLVFYWSLCSCFILLAPISELLRLGAFIAADNASIRASAPSTLRGRYSPPQIQNYLDKQFPVPPSRGFFREVLHTANQELILYNAGLNAATILLWPWLTLAALMIFQASIRKAKVQRGHVLRCVLYSADASVWYLLAIILAMIALITVASVRGGRVGGWRQDEWTVMLVWALWLVRLDRLWTANGKYLQFDHPFLTALASQIVVVLAGAAALFWGGRVVRWMITGTWSL